MEWKGKEREKREEEKVGERGREEQCEQTEPKKKKGKKKLRSLRRLFSPSQRFPLFFFTTSLSSSALHLTMAVGKNKRVSKRGKGGRKKAYV